MTNDQLQSLIRAILSAAGGFFIGKGWFNVDTWNWIAGGAAVAVPGIWGWLSNRPAAIAAAAQAIPGVTVQTSPAAPKAVVESVAAAKAN
jgi:hypothetical protein